MQGEKKAGAVITAAGLSTRMKAFKQTLTLGEMTFAEHVVSRFAAVGADPIVVVTGHRAAEVEQALAGYPVTFLHNPEYETTQMLDTVKIGFDYIRDHCDRVFLTPVDIPLFSVETLRSELAAEEPVVIPVDNRQTGHPILLDTALIPRILAYRGEGGLRGAIDSLGLTPCYVEVNDQGSLIDADTPDDYEKLRAYQASCGSADQ